MISCIDPVELISQFAGCWLDLVSTLDDWQSLLANPYVFIYSALQEVPRTWFIAQRKIRFCISLILDRT